MRKITNRLIAVLLVLVSLLSLSACGGSAPAAEPEKNIDAVYLMSSLLGGVVYASELEDIGEGAEVFFPGLPEGATAVMYMGNAKYADELSMVTVADAAQVDAAVESVREYIKQKRDQFLHYIPEEVAKIDKAIVWTNGVHIILCITDDVTNAQLLMDNAYEVGKVPATEPPTEPPTEAPTDAPAEDTYKAPQNYEEYLALSSDDLTRFMESFPSVDDFFDWVKAERKKYEDAKDKIQVGSDGIIDLG